ncbi:MAG: MATE family efflux transporter, partial [Spirochaetia bacterium]|nr:MATE family efflux transporter [Spirochaetia bacterium]
MISIALPVVFQSLLNNSLSFVDTLMIGQLGEASIAAVALANQMFFLISLLFFGVSSSSAIFLSQFWGARNKTNIQKVLGLSLTIAGVGAAICSLASLLLPRQIMYIFTTESQVVEIGVSYLEIVAISYLFSAISQILATALRVIGQAKIPLLVALFSLSFNALGNYLLIFGIGPFPELGVQGAAIATTISRFLEVSILLWIVYRRHPVIALKSREAFRWNKQFLLRIIPTSLPVILNEIFWALGMTTYKIAYSRMGIEAIAAINVAESVGNLFFVAMMGVGNASLIMIGVKIGEKQQDLARLYAKRFIITFIHPASPINHQMVNAMARKGIIGLTLDGVPRISRAQNMDALTSMSTCAGYKGMLIAANYMKKFIPQIFSAVGMIKPANVLVIGAGVSGP